MRVVRSHVDVTVDSCGQSTVLDLVRNLPTEHDSKRTSFTASSKACLISDRLAVLTLTGSREDEGVEEDEGVTSEEVSSSGEATDLPLMSLRAIAEKLREVRTGRCTVWLASSTNSTSTYRRAEGRTTRATTSS